MQWAHNNNNIGDRHESNHQEVKLPKIIFINNNNVAGESLPRLLSR